MELSRNRSVIQKAICTSANLCTSTNLGDLRYRRPQSQPALSVGYMSDRIEDLKNRLLGVSESKTDLQSARLLAAIVESSDDAIASKDLNGIVISWNKGAERIFGYAAEEIIGKPISILIPSDRENEEPFILDRIRRGERIDHYDTVRKRKDGTLIDIALTVSPIIDEKGRVIGASKIARDITAHKKQERFITLLSREVDHRAKNLLAVIQAIVNLTEGDTPAGVKNAISGRIQALANAHNLLAVSHWEGTTIKNIVEQELAPIMAKSTRPSWPAVQIRRSALKRLSRLRWSCTNWRPMPQNMARFRYPQVAFTSSGP